MRLCVDMIEFCAREVPQWNPVSISGYHIREAGSTAAQELAFTLADGFTTSRRRSPAACRSTTSRRGSSFFFNAHNDFFEEIAKYRAARRIWARELRETYGAKDERSWKMRFHAQTAGVSLHGAAAGAEPRARGHRGPGGGARRLPVAAHELLRRDAGPADGARGHDRPAHAAGDRRGDRRHEHHRPARRLVVPRGPHEPPGAARPTRTSQQIRERGGVVQAIRDNFFQAEIAEAASATSRRSSAASGASSASTPTPRTRRSPRRCTASTRTSSARSAARVRRIARHATPPRSRPPGAPARRR